MAAIVIYLVCASSPLSFLVEGTDEHPPRTHRWKLNIAMTTPDDKIRQIAKTAQDYYDADDVFNYYRQVKYRTYSRIQNRGLTGLL